MLRLGQIPGRLYRGEISVNIVSRQKMWYLISGVILVVSVAAVLIRGLNFSVEFRGGSVFEFPAQTTSGAISRIVSNAGGGSSSQQYLAGPKLWQVTTGQLSSNLQLGVQKALEAAYHVADKNMNVQFIGPSWGSGITDKAIEALIIFLVVIVIYLSIAFEWKMAAAAFVALLHDIVITIGVYALVGFSVSPTSVIGLLTILGYSLYDTVVVFDKVRENTAGLITSERSTYSTAANLALNQTLVRSINTSLTALIPVASILFIGGALLGTGTLNDLSLVLFVGMLSGTYSSLCIATPVLADLKEREPAMRKLRERVQRRDAGGRAAARRAAEAAAKGEVSPGVKDSVIVTEPDDRDDPETVLGPDEGSELTPTPAATRPTATRTTVRQQQSRRPGTGSSGQRRKRR
ncbi:MAG TPA: protein translocase subunit SecF [Trebonia sp.]|nr:protein translocase subunit SecF [Trebonia sp.]